MSGPSVGDKVGRERRAEDVEAHRRLVREVEIIDGLEKRKVRASREAREARLLPMRDLFGDQQREEVAIAPGLALRALHEVAPDAARIGEMQALEEGVEVVIGGIMTGLRRGERMPPCSAASRCCAALRPCGRRRRPGPSLRAAAAWPRSSAAGPMRSNGSARRRGLQVVRDVLGADGLLVQAPREGRAQRGIAVRLQAACATARRRGPRSSGGDG